MPYSNDPTNIATDRVRLMIGDVWPDIELLSDADYAFFLAKFDGNENRAAMDAARSILFKLSRYVRERTGDIEVYGSDWFKDYAKALDMILKDPNLSLSIAMPYAGGIDKDDMYNNDNVEANVTRNIYIGFTSGRRLYEQCNTGDFVNEFFY